MDKLHKFVPDPVMYKQSPKEVLDSVVSTVAVTIPAVPTEEWFNTLSPEQRKLLAMWCIMGEQYFTVQPILRELSSPIQFEPLEPSLNGPSIELDKFLLRQSMQPVVLSTPPLGSPYLQYEDLPNQKPNDKPQCNDVTMSVEVSVEPDTKESDSLQSQEKKPSNDVATLTDQSENQE
jgi:hypothetical protein